MEPETGHQQLRKSIESRIDSAAKTPRHPESIETAVKARMMAGKMQKTSAELLMQRNIKVSGEILRWRTDPKLRTISSMRLTEEQANNFISQVSCPWLVIFGSEGFEKLKINFEKRKHLAQHLDQVTCLGGHHLHMDHPAPVAEKIIGFLP